MPVYFQYQGESLPWIQSFGFQGLLLNRLPDETLLTEAHAAKLDVFCPPPAQPLAMENRSWESVKGWLVGSGVDARSLEQLRSETARLAQFPEPMQRPILVEAMEQYWSFGRVADELIVPIQSNVSAGSVREKHEWLTAAVAESKKRGAGWVSIATDPLPSWNEQLIQAQRIVEPAAPPPDAVDPWQLRLQAIRAAAAGARGLILRSSVPLEANNPEHRPRLAALRTINRDMAVMGPWLVGGSPSAPPVIDRDDYFSAAWTASKSHLVLFHTSSESSQFVLPATQGRPLKATMPLPTGIHDVIRLTSGRMERMRLTPSVEGMTWTIEQPQPVEICVLTDNPLVLRHLDRTASQQIAMEAAEDHLDVAAHQLGLATRVIAARWPDAVDPLARQNLATADAAQMVLDQGYNYLRANNAPRAVEAAAQCYEAAEIILNDAYQTAVRNLAAPETSPFVLTPSTLSYHWLMARSCERSVWRPVPLAGSELLDTQAMESAGWSQQRRLEDKAETLVELIPPGADQRNTPGLRLAAAGKPKQRLVGGYEGAAIRVRSAPAEINKGDLVRVSAKAFVRRASNEPGSGLLVYDNQAGPALGQLVRGKPGELVEIELYRFVVNDEPFRVLAEMRGACDIVIESITLSAIEPAVNRSSYITTPR
ncbi:MAG: hypothetical protein U0892_18865 [Pirellulales bacterium]